ncbi:MAG: Sec-independent protein translocase subunit TatA [Carbonactinosporaceae bacterium]
MFPNLRPTEIILILLLVILLFGAKKLPDTARGMGRALRIFKSETKGMRDEDSDDNDGHNATAAAPRQIEAPTQSTSASVPDQHTSHVTEPQRGPER